ncbi:hypothetical protein DPMN_151985 [Dreissena polymorpha]|uniref:Uncharacterized protein n=1 Tax=Dreissena polymorpha TaxID=45954 RepID=A0A9D4FKI7_DREPO|nr:hypothetical protein DPMN_151985 [Dreissena polymorpha]
MCPGILRKLWSLLRVIWRKGKIPDCWKKAEEIFAPKEKDSRDITLQCRYIADRYIALSNISRFGYGSQKSDEHDH